MSPAQGDNGQHGVRRHGKARYGSAWLGVALHGLACHVVAEVLVRRQETETQKTTPSKQKKTRATTTYVRYCCIMGLMFLTSSGLQASDARCKTRDRGQDVHNTLLPRDAQMRAQVACTGLRESLTSSRALPKESTSELDTCQASLAACASM